MTNALKWIWRHSFLYWIIHNPGKAVIVTLIMMLLWSIPLGIYAAKCGEPATSREQVINAVQLRCE